MKMPIFSLPVDSFTGVPVPTFTSTVELADGSLEELDDESLEELDDECGELPHAASSNALTRATATGPNLA
jgi:hypothetical protein